MRPMSAPTPKAMEAFSKMAYESTAKAGAAPQPHTDGNGSSTKDDPIDAEFEVKND